MILVVGGSGRLGRRVVHHLAADGPVRVMTRNPAGAPGAETVRGDLLDTASVDAALAGADVVVCTAHGGGGTGANGPRGIEGRALPRLIDAALAADVRHFVYVSSTSATPDSPSPYFRAKASVVDHLVASGLSCSVVRPTHLMETWADVLGEPMVRRSRAMVFGRGENPVSFVAADDVAQVLARLARQPGTGERIDLGGPQALTVLQVNALLAEALHIRVTRTSRLSGGLLRTMSGLVRPFSELASRQMLLGALLDQRPQTVDSRVEWARFGIRPRTFADWLAEHGDALRTGRHSTPEGLR